LSNVKDKQLIKFQKDEPKDKTSFATCLNMPLTEKEEAEAAAAAAMVVLLLMIYYFCT
jgi:hypothetical protein